MEHDLVDERERDLEVEAEGPYDPDQHDWHEQLPAMPHIRQALAQVASLTNQPRSGKELGGTHHEQAGDHCDEGRRISEKDPCRADPVDQQARGCGPDDARGVERGTVQADGIRQLLATDQLGHERLSSRVVNCRHHPEQEREEVHVVQSGGTNQVQQPERKRDQAHRHLRGQNELALGETIGDDTTLQSEQQDREELQRCGDPDRGPAVVGEAEDKPVLTDPLHPGAGQRHELAAGEQAVIADPQRSEGTAHESASLSMTGTARRRASRSAGSSSFSRHASQACLRLRSSTSRSRPRSVSASTHWRLSVG